MKSYLPWAAAGILLCVSAVGQQKNPPAERVQKTPSTETRTPPTEQSPTKQQPQPEQQTPSQAPSIEAKEPGKQVGFDM